MASKDQEKSSTASSASSCSKTFGGLTRVACIVFWSLGDKAAAIREQEAFGGTLDTFDDWIRSENFGHTFIYDCMKAARIFRLTAPIAEPLKIVLNRESHYRDSPPTWSNARQRRSSPAWSRTSSLARMA